MWLSPLSQKDVAVPAFPPRFPAFPLSEVAVLAVNPKWVQPVLFFSRQKYLKPEYSPQAASVGFTGFISRVATEHQYGLRGRINERISVQYPQRELLGFTVDEQDMIEEAIVRHLAMR